MALGAAVISLAVAEAIRLRFKLGRLGRFHTRLDYDY